MFMGTWILLKRVTLVVGIALSLFAVIEVLHGYQVLAGVHPALGYSFLAVIVSLILVAVFMGVRALLVLPRALVPPHIGSFQDASPSNLVRYQQYLGAYLGLLSINESLSESQRSSCDRARTEILSAHKNSLSTELARIESEVVVSAVGELERQAGVAVHDCVRDVMLAVSLSPYRAADLLIVGYRNVAMLLRIIRIFDTRPPLQSQFVMLRDILSVVATVNYLNMGEKLIESIGAKIPFVGQAVDDVSQGVGAGIMTSTVGHAAIQRCGAFRGWDAAEGAESMRSMIGRFVRDVGQIWNQDVLGSLRSRLGEQWETVRTGVGESITNLSSNAGDFVKMPAVSFGVGMATGGTTVLRGTAGAMRASGDFAIKAGETAGNLAVGVGQTVVTGVQEGAQATVRGAQMTGQHAAGLASSGWSGTIRIAKTGTAATVETAHATANLVVETSKSAWKGTLGVGKSLSRWAFRGEDEGSLNAQVSEERYEIVVEITVPGVPREEIHVEFEDKRLIIRTEKDERHEAATCIIELPESVDSENVSAKLEGGILTVRVPKKLAGEPKGTAEPSPE